MRKAACWLFAAAIFFSMSKPICFAERALTPLEYSQDKFTGVSQIKQKLSFGVVDTSFLFPGGNSIDLILEHTKGQAESIFLLANLGGAASSFPRVSQDNNYLGTAELYLIVDGENIKIPISKIKYIGDFKSTNYIRGTRYSSPESYEQHDHRIEFYLEVSKETLAKIANAEVVEASLREILPNNELEHEFRFKGKHYKQIKQYLLSVKN